MTHFEPEPVGQDYRVNTSDYLSQGWAIFKPHAWEFVAFVALLAIINFGLSTLPYPIGMNDDNQGGLASTILSPVLGAGFYIVALHIMKGRSHTFTDFFNGFQTFLPILLVNLISSLIVVVGLLLLIIPGVYFAVSYVFGLCFVIEKRLDFWSALEASRKIVTRQWFSMFGFVLILVLINLGGLLLCGLGLFVTIPWTICALVAAYRDIVGFNLSDSDSISDSFSDSF